MLFRLLEKTVPLYHHRVTSGLPHGWVQVIREAIRTAVQVFSTRRMLRERIERIYLPAMRAWAKHAAFAARSQVDEATRLCYTPDILSGPQIRKDDLSMVEGR